MSAPAISLVMPCHERAHDLARVLRAYDAQEGDVPFEIVAVDDGSRDTTGTVLAGYRPRRYALRVERLAVNSGPAAARNRGLELAQAPIVLFVGDDIVPAPDLVAGHVRAHQAHPDPGAAILGRVAWPADLPRTTLMEHIDGIGAQQFSYHYLADGAEYDYRHFYTANVSLKSRLVRDTGVTFDTSFPHAAMEDAEFAYRLAARGLRIRYAAALLGHHYHFHTIWSFAERQRVAGLMAAHFVRKHPEVAGSLRVTQTRLLAALPLLVALERRVRPGLDAATLEHYALTLASTYEWTPHGLLDELYLGVLDYFWQKGIIAGVCGARAARVSDAYAAVALAPLLRRFLERAPDFGVPLPFAHPGRLHAQLLRSEPLLLRRPILGRTVPQWARWAWGEVHRRAQQRDTTA
jgi:glycosyltransferase involved in cell wall biosynthesis